MPPSHLFGFASLLSAGITLMVLLIMGRFYQRKKLTGSGYGSYFLPALGAHLAGSIFFGLVHYFVLGKGDTFSYYTCISLVWEQLLQHPSHGIDMLLAAPGDSILPNHIYFTQRASLVVIKVGTLFSLLTANSFWAISCCFGGVSFLGCWAFFRAVIRINGASKAPRLHALFLLFLPSLLFWGGGIMKDALALAALYYLLSALIRLLLFQEQAWKMGLQIFIAAYFLGIIRIFVLQALLPAVLLWLFLLGVKQVASVKYRRLIYLGGLGVVLGVMAYFNGLPASVMGYYEWHQSVGSPQVSRSTYELPGGILGWLGMIGAAPHLIGLCLFRPFPWEWSSLLTLASGLESLLLMGFMGWTVYKRGILPSFHQLRQSPVALFLLTFCLILAFALGLFSGNFGSLVRYRMPLLPLFLAILLIIQSPKQ